MLLPKSSGLLYTSAVTLRLKCWLWFTSVRLFHLYLLKRSCCCFRTVFYRTKLSDANSPPGGLIFDHKVQKNYWFFEEGKYLTTNLCKIVKICAICATFLWLYSNGLAYCSRVLTLITYFRRYLIEPSGADYVLPLRRFFGCL